MATENQGNYSSIIKELTELEQKEEHEEKSLNHLRILVIVIVIVAAGAISYLWYANSRASAFILDDQKLISELEKKVQDIESSQPNPVTGARISLKSEELKAIPALVCDVGGAFTLGSGTVWDESGLIYTNKHVLQNQKGKVGDKVLCAVLITDDVNRSPALTYFAAPIRYSKSQDVALLKIIGDKNGDLLKSDMKFQMLKKGDSTKEALPTGSYVAIAGYPVLGGSTFTLTEGVIAGRTPVFSETDDFIKTDAKIEQGNSGGAALNFRREYIGIPTFGAVGRIESINYIIPISEVDKIKDWVNLSL